MLSHAVSRSMANNLLHIKRPIVSAAAACETRGALEPKAGGRTEGTCDTDVKHGRDTDVKHVRDMATDGRMAGSS